MNILTLPIPRPCKQNQGVLCLSSGGQSLWALSKLKGLKHKSSAMGSSKSSPAGFREVVYACCPRRCRRCRGLVLIFGRGNTSETLAKIGAFGGFGKVFVCKATSSHRLKMLRIRVSGVLFWSTPSFRGLSSGKVLPESSARNYRDVPQCL